MSSIQLRAELLTALQTLATGELRASATTLLEKLGYARDDAFSLGKRLIPDL